MRKERRAYIFSLNFVARDIKAFAKHPRASSSIDSGPFVNATIRCQRWKRGYKKKKKIHTPRTYCCSTEDNLLLIKFSPRIHELSIPERVHLTNENVLLYTKKVGTYKKKKIKKRNAYEKYKLFIMEKKTYGATAVVIPSHLTISSIILICIIKH